MEIILRAPEGERAEEIIQEALDRCRDAGGGKVILEAGRYDTGSLRMYSRTELYLKKGVRLKGSADWRDYRDYDFRSTMAYIYNEKYIQAWHLPDHYTHALITAVEAEDVAITGEEGAVIDGSDCFDPAGEEGFRGPFGIVMSRCRGVRLTGYTVENAANWAHQLDSCENVRMTGVRVLAGHDGVNLHHCTHVELEDCVFETGDDCVAGYDVEDLRVSRCGFNSSCNGFRLGGRNVRIQDCSFAGPGRYKHRISGRHNMLFAFCYYALPEDLHRGDSGNWEIENCSFADMEGLIYYNHEHADDLGIQSGVPLRSVTFRKISVHGLRCHPTFAGPGVLTLEEVRSV